MATKRSSGRRSKRARPKPRPSPEESPKGEEADASVPPLEHEGEGPPSGEAEASGSAEPPEAKAAAEEEAKPKGRPRRRRSSRKKGTTRRGRAKKDAPAGTEGELPVQEAADADADTEIPVEEGDPVTEIPLEDDREDNTATDTESGVDDLEEPYEVEVGFEEPTDQVPVSEVTPVELASALEEELERTRERLRALARDFERYRVRTREQAEKARASLTADVISQLLPVLDNLERANLPAQGNAEIDASSLRLGVDMVMRQFQQVLRVIGVLEVTAGNGSPFDPKVHNAFEVVHRPDLPDGSVLHVLLKGYLLGERLIRPAMVRVARNVELPATNDEGLLDSNELEVGGVSEEVVISESEEPTQPDIEDLDA